MGLMSNNTLTYASNHILDSLIAQSIKQRHPLRCSLELTYRCNFNCKMCYVRMTDGQAKPYGCMRTAEEWLSLAQQMKDAGVLRLTLTGGECTQYPDFDILYSELSKMGFQINIMSNAGSYNSKIRRVFEEYPPHSVAISLYGGSNESYRIVTGDPLGYEKTVQNIYFFKELGVPVSLNFTIIRENVLDLPKIDRLCSELGIHYTIITDLVGHQKDASFSLTHESRLSAAEQACIINHPPHEVELALERAKDLEKELDNFTVPVNPEMPVPRVFSCIASFCSSAVHWNGDMTPCISFSGYKPVKPFEVGFKNAWKQLMDRRDQVYKLSPTCSYCEMYDDCPRHCPARNFEGTGDPLTPDPEICKYTFLLRKYREKLKNPPELPPSPPCS